MPEKVLISGASGFIAAHTVKQLVEGGFDVVGTVRSAEKGEFFKAQYPELFHYEIVKDIAEPDAFNEVFKKHTDIKYVLHTASPFNFNVTTAKEYLIPAVNGTLSMLKAAKEYGQNVERVVVTSSFAASCKMPFPLKDPGFVYNEDSWSDITREAATNDNDLLSAYCGSKYYAEKAAWEFVETEKPSFTLTTIQVPYVWGPPVNNIGLKNLNTSNEVIQNLLDGKNGQEFGMMVPFYIDVRDAAKTHVVAMKSPGLANKRCFSVGGKINDKLAVDVLKRIRPSIADRFAKSGLDAVKLDETADYDNSRTVKELGFKYLSLEDTLGDTADWIIERE